MKKNQNSLEEIVNPFETPKTEDKTEDKSCFDFLRYRIPRSMVLGSAFTGAFVINCLGIFAEKKGHFPDLSLMAEAYILGTVTLYGSSLIYDGVRKLITKNNQPYSWFL